MSGICGIVHFDEKPVDSGQLDRMISAAIHRGPDGTRSWIVRGAGLAHLALHVTPESVYESQPCVSADGKLVLVADATIHNRDELLGRLGPSRVFSMFHGSDLPPESSSPSDAELILAAYRVWGRDCVRRILGDFAFVVWDAENKTVFAARDAMAMRALYYLVDRGRLFFGSEAKQILTVLSRSPDLFEPAIAAFLAGHFHPVAWTPFENIYQLPPGHALEVGAAMHRTWRYWDINPKKRIIYRDSAEYVEHLCELFKEAVRSRIRTHRPIGILLSGGMDSGSIAATAGWYARHRNGEAPAIRAYSWAFDAFPECDERHISSRTAAYYGFPTTDIPAGDAMPLTGYPEVGPDPDDPFTGVYQELIESALRQAQSDNVRLMLSGDRGDLMMGGGIYDYSGLFREGKWKALLDELRIQATWRDASLGSMVKKHLFSPMLGALWPEYRGKRVRKAVHRTYRKLRNVAPSPAYPVWIRPEFAARSGLTEMPKKESLPRTIKGLARRRRYEAISAAMHMRGMIWSERTYSRFSLGFADPWSDRRLAEFAVAVPQQVLNRTGDDKRLVRQAMAGIMPEDVRQAARKITPLPVYLHALRTDARDVVLDLLTDSRAEARGYIDSSVLKRHFAEVVGGADVHPMFWWALALEMWLRRMDRSGA